ncbi:MAG TPA: ankyrin repeat domain-containing protein [Terriglobia bacterium]|nr:ankyrin repeat domain-containing protein [Terriglobia bacterium]
MTRRTIVACSALLLLCIAGLSLGAGRSDVADAVMKGDKAGLTRLLQQKADVNAAQIDGATALHWAAYRNDLEAADLLIRAGAKVNVMTREGITPLYMASLYGNPPMISRLLQAGADAKERGPNGETMLMLAARNGNPDAIKVLLAAGVDPNLREPKRDTSALMWAVEQQHPAAVKALLDGGADVSARTGASGLPRAYMANAVNTTVAEAVRRGGAARAEAARAGAAEAEARRQSIFNRGNRGRGGNAAGARGAAAPDGAAAAPDVNPDDPDAQDAPQAGLVGGGGGGLTALVFAARQGDLESAKLLVEAGADVNQVTEFGWSPLLTATNNRNYQLGKFLIEHGADVSLANKGGMTPLYLATDNRNIEGGDYPVPKADMDHLDFIKILLDRGANVNHQVKSNTETRTIFTMQWFFESGATAFVRAAQSGDVTLMKLLLAHGADPKIVTDLGDTALSICAGIGWVEGITYEWSPKENVEAVKMLLDLGLDPNAANKEGRTALMGAALKGRNEVVQLLGDHGARLDTRDKGSRDTDKFNSKAAGHTWEALDYAEGLVRVGVQSAIARPETAALLRKLMAEKGLPVPPANRNIDSICIVEICDPQVNR